MSVAERTIGRLPATGPFGGATAAWTALVGDGAGPTWSENGGGFSVVVRAPAFARAPTTPGVPLAARGSGVGTWTARGSPSGWIFSLLDGAVAPDAMGCVAGFARLGNGAWGAWTALCVSVLTFLAASGLDVATGCAAAPGVALGATGTGACGIEARPPPLSSPLSIFAAVDFDGAIGFATSTAGMCAGRGGCFG